MIEPALLQKISYAWILLGIVIFPILLFVKQPYGRHYRKGWGPSLSNRTAWIVMEIPSLILIAYFYFWHSNYNLIASILTIMWLGHYINRTLIFPFRIKTKGKRMPLIIVVFGIFFNLVNATLNGMYISMSDFGPGFSGYQIMGMVVGILLFMSGMILNMLSDKNLIGLRKSSANGYQIPRNGLFEWISCPNYFGEIIEWTGFAILAWNPAALSFAVWTIVNLLPRALDHHKWYKSTFKDYPEKRKAIIPFIL
ncbi:MAG: DUF1295 domain-containing protein [Bacteroidales bacterium]